MEAQCDPLGSCSVNENHGNSGQFLFPQNLSESLPFLSEEIEFSVDVLEVPLQGSSVALHHNCVFFQSNVDNFLNVDSLKSLQSCNRCGKKL